MTPQKKTRIIMCINLGILLVYDAIGLVIYAKKGYIDIVAWGFVLIPILLIANSFILFQMYLNKQSKQLNEYNLSIDDMIKLIEAKFDDAKSAAQKKTDFLSKMSHEIRTPINSVLGMNEMIVRESTEDNIVDYAINVRNSGNMLLSLINDVLDFSKIESGKMELVPVEYQPASLINDLVNMTKSRMEGTNLELLVETCNDIPCIVLGDDVRIKQVLVNLLTNAVKYTKEGTVTFSVSGQQEDNFYRFRFAVTDTGIGIAPENIDSLTKEFVRVDLQRNRQIEGTGLGLAITSQLLELMGSELQIESVLGKGSTFSFEVEQKIVDFTPMGEFSMSCDRVKNSHQVSFQAPDAHILVVDDTPTNRQVVKGLLKGMRLKIDEADSGEECLKMIHEKKYELIFMDHMMPGMDGVETLHKLRQSTYHYNVDTPVVILTANAIAGVREKYLQEGFDDFLAKPIIPEKLEEIVAEFIPDDLKLSVEEAPSLKRKDLSFLDSLPQVEGLDWRYGYSHFEDEALLMEAVEAYYRALPGQINKLEDLLKKLEESQTDSMENFRIQIHSMKSAANIIGLISLGGMAFVLEGLAKDINFGGVRAVAPVFIEVATGYQEKLKACIAEEEKVKITDTNELIQALAQLQEAVDCVDIDVADSIIVFLRSFEYTGELKQQFEALEAAVVDLDGSSCQQIISNILVTLV